MNVVALQSSVVRRSISVKHYYLLVAMFGGGVSPPPKHQLLATGLLQKVDLAHHTLVGPDDDRAPARDPVAA